MTVRGTKLSSYFSTTIVLCFRERVLLCQSALLRATRMRQPMRASPGILACNRIGCASVRKINRYVGGSFDLSAPRKLRSHLFRANVVFANTGGCLIYERY